MALMVLTTKNSMKLTVLVGGGWFKKAVVQSNTVSPDGYFNLRAVSPVEFLVMLILKYFIIE